MNRRTKRRLMARRTVIITWRAAIDNGGCNVEIGERINVKSFNFGGMATIMHIEPGEMYPIQVELDHGDADGHKIKRIASNEIIQDGQEPPEPVGIAFTGPDDPQRYIGNVASIPDGYRFEMGEQFVLGVAKYPGVYKPGPAKSFYLYEPDDLAHRGCMPATMFSDIVPYDPALVRPKNPRIKLVSVSIKKDKPKPAKVEKVAKHVPDEQMNIFDFLEV